MHSFGLKAMVVLGLLACAQVARAADPQFTTLFNFKPSIGMQPSGGLVRDGSGGGFGVTSAGGVTNRGTVFQAMEAPHGGAVVKTIYSFSGAKDCAVPVDGVVRGAGGKLYGATQYGGAFDQGCVYQLTPPAASVGAWTETVLYSFGGSDGSLPAAGLVIGSDGSLYGTTSNGGASYEGTVFKLAPPSSPGGGWVETTLHVFDGTNGGIPQTRMIIRNKALIGTTAGGSEGSPGGGVFELVPPAKLGGAWTYLVLHAFQFDGQSREPSGPLLPFGGSLYGVTNQGGPLNSGTVYKLTPGPTTKSSWAFSQIYSFTYYTDGEWPNGDLSVEPDGSLYGVTNGGMPSPGEGPYASTVFKLTPPASAGGAWTDTTLHTFTSADGGLPTDLGLRGQLFGLSNGGSAIAGPYGTIFRLNP